MYACVMRLPCVLAYTQERHTLVRGSNNMHRMRRQLVGKVNGFLYVGSANANLLTTCTMHERDLL